MSLESPIFGSQTERQEASKGSFVDLKPAEAPKMDSPEPKSAPLEGSPTPMMESKSPIEGDPSALKDTGLSGGPSRGHIDNLEGSDIVPKPLKNKIGFGPFKREEEKVEIPKVIKSPVESAAPSAEAPKVEPTPVPETPVSNVNEKSMFGQKEAGRKVNFLEMAELSEGDYDLLVEDLKEKVDNVKKLGDNILKWSGLKLAGRASKATAEGLVKSAVFARRVSEYGWWRFGKEASVDATKYAAKKIVEKGAKAAWGWVSKKEGVMNFINEQIEKAQKEAQEKKDKLAATVKQLEELKAKGIISNFKLKVPLNG